MFYFSLDNRSGQNSKGMFSTVNHCLFVLVVLIDLLCLTPLSAIFQLYHGDQF
jgi:hypothetical protein